IIAASILGVLLVAIGTVAVIRALSSDKADPYIVRDESSQTSSTSDEAVTQTETSNESSSSVPDPSGATSSEEDAASTIDPSTVNTIDIVPMDITVSYVKGAGGFEFEVLRTPNGSQYVEF